MLIDLTYFWGQILIAQRSQPEVADNIEMFIKKYEPKVLEHFLGKDLYEDFKAGLEENPVPQKWQDLKKWLLDDDLKTSPIANYIYYFYQENEVIISVGIGMASTKSENVDKASPTKNMVRAWNEICENFQEVHNHIRENIDDYPNYRSKHQHFIISIGHVCACGGHPVFRVKNSWGI